VLVAMLRGMRINGHAADRIEHAARRPSLVMVIVMHDVGH
jgi:hypothetical protein